ncbi:MULTISPECIES: trypsin-like serine peptidase [unclassified Streptomyces]|uniref:trypsin-like serine peptidase n=1 Tax=unclassified Streptomyces TaxID=2593676 RepID=UPI00404187EC
MIVSVALTAPQASARPAPASSARVSTAQQAAALKFWTPDRLARAVDLDMAPSTATGRHSNATGAPGHLAQPFSVPAAMPGSDRARDRDRVGHTAHIAASAPQRWTGGGLISTTAGKVFFTNPENGGTYACSGDAVNSGNKSVVATAGHCVVDTDGTAYTNWVFIPGYDHGNRPFGTFTATSLHWEPQRIGDADAAWDAAFATVGTVNGRRLVDTVGGEGIGFDQTPGQYVYSFGYGGSAAEGGGEQMNWCAGTEVFQSGHAGGGIWGIDCVQTGGSSGGPFLARFDTGNGTGMQIGNISIGAGDYEYHPYYGKEAAGAYNEAGS